VKSSCKNKRGKLLTNQTTVIVDITICKTTLVRSAEHWKPTHISPDCPLISDEEREATAKRREAALADRSRVVRFRPSPAWLTRDKQQTLIRQGHKPHHRFVESHNVEMD
jgi:hypothetical protein